MTSQEPVPLISLNAGSRAKFAKLFASPQFLGFLKSANSSHLKPIETVWGLIKQRPYQYSPLPHRTLSSFGWLYRVGEEGSCGICLMLFKTLCTGARVKP
jgi:hypothetical protein